MAAGAVMGVLVRYLMYGIWPDQLETFWTTLVTVSVSCAVLGFAATKNSGRLAPLATGFAGSAASISVVSLLAVSASPAVCAGYLLLTPVTALIGIGAGLIAGVTLRPKAQAVVDNA
ncbi:MAG: hypothetical protein QOH60_500 [Mycobacterium sp.]|nr:hypothetical protein [Mycobacterium sp.]